MPRIRLASKAALARLFVSVSAGVLISVAIAWTFALRAPARGWHEDPLAWGAFRLPDGGSFITWTHRRVSAGFVIASSEQYPIFPRDSDDDIRFRMTLDNFPSPVPLSSEPPPEHIPTWGEYHLLFGGWDGLFGWPMPCLWATLHRTYESAFPDEFDGRSTLPLWPAPAGSRARIVDPQGRVCLPVGVLWEGLVADTGLFALGCWIVLVVPPSVRRAWRRSRNRCPKCGYSLAGLPQRAGCPECGQECVPVNSGSELHASSGSID